MNGLKTTIYRKSKDLPEVEGGNFFHSKQLFEFLQKTPRQKPYMVVVEDEQGRILSHMLGFLRYRTFIFPPFLLVHCRVLGEGEYAESEYPKEELFGEMLGALTQALNTRTLYIEVSMDLLKPDAGAFPNLLFISAAICFPYPTTPTFLLPSLFD